MIEASTVLFYKLSRVQGQPANVAEVLRRMRWRNSPSLGTSLVTPSRAVGVGTNLR